MARICPKCGKIVNSDGFCPNCDEKPEGYHPVASAAEQPKQSENEHHVLFAVVAVVIAAAVALAGIWVFFNKTEKKEEEISSDLSKIIYEVHDTDVWITGCNDPDATDITIPSTIDGKPVTTIKQNAFKGNTKLRKIKLPDTMTVVAGRAFAGCTSLTKVEFNDGLNEIGDSAFEDCTSLKKIKLPPSLKVIGDEAFKNCKSLVKAEIPDELPEFGKDVFKNCDKLIEKFSIDDYLKLFIP